MSAGGVSQTAPIACGARLLFLIGWVQCDWIFSNFRAFAPILTADQPFCARIHKSI
ncbi:hypothetical protein B4113_1989 [Geobacillus sp. B4113_201601]|nr:hypothetical protein B4113_1989 [Geobacillus sp. B4113_201601]